MILLDTCALIWLASDSPALSRGAKDALLKNSGYLFVSSFSAWEIALKSTKGKLTLQDLSPADWFARVLSHHHLTEIPVNAVIAAGSVALPPLHSDPADRVLIATAQLHGLAVLTPDPLIQRYPDLRTVW